MYELHRISGRYALVTMCIGGGQGIAAVFERLEAGVQVNRLDSFAVPRSGECSDVVLINKGSRVSGLCARRPDLRSGPPGATWLIG